MSWRRGEADLDRESAIDVLSGALAAVDCVTGVHVCGDGDLGLALEAGPQVLGVEVGPELVRDTVALARFLDGDGWIAWGAVPTDRPVGESADPHWRALAACGASSRGGVRSGAASHARDDHPGVRPRGLRCLAGRAGARHRARARRAGARPGCGGASHTGSLTWRPPRTATAGYAANRSSPVPPSAATAAPRPKMAGMPDRRRWTGEGEPTMAMPGAGAAGLARAVPVVAAASRRDLRTTAAEEACRRAALADRRAGVISPSCSSV